MINKVKNEDIAKKFCTADSKVLDKLSYEINLITEKDTDIKINLTSAFLSIESIRCRTKGKDYMYNLRNTKEDEKINNIFTKAIPQAMVTTMKKYPEYYL